MWQSIARSQSVVNRLRQSHFFHLVAGTEPAPSFYLFLFVGVKIAGAERPAQGVQMVGQAQNHAFG
jgi:hypothetical protein